MDTKLAFTVVYETVEDGWTQARIEELPAVITVAPTLDEAKELLLDALREFLLALGHPELALGQPEPLPVPDTAKRGSLDIVLHSSGRP